MSVNNQVKKLRSDVENLKSEMKTVKTDVASMKERNVVDDLTKERFPGSGKPLFTYGEIGKRNGVSDATVARVADRNDLSRREKRNHDIS
jgi:hypothetical protein